MGFRQGAFAKIWSVRPVSNTLTSARISISRRNRQSGEYEQDFGGFVSFIGTACSAKALGLKEGDKIKLGDVDVTNRFDKDKNQTYTNFCVFSFESSDAAGYQGQRAAQPAQSPSNDESFSEVDDDNLPF